MFFSLIFSVDENVIKVHNNKDVELLCQDLIDATLESDQYVGQSKRYHLVLDVAIAGFKGHLLFIAFFNPHLIVGIG